MQSVITWIATDVELPDDSITVLVALESSDEPTWIGYYDSAEDDWFNSDGLRFQSAVSHWAELPQIPGLVDRGNASNHPWAASDFDKKNNADRPIGVHWIVREVRQ